MYMSNRPINKKGTPISEKQDHEFEFSYQEFDPYRVPAHIQKELDEKGLVARFVNIKNIERNGGFDGRGWRPYKPETNNTQADFLFGNSPDGLVRRDDVVLAVKTKEEVSKQRRYLDQKAQAHSAQNMIKRSRNQMQDYIRETGTGKYFKATQDEE